MCSVIKTTYESLNLLNLIFMILLPIKSISACIPPTPSTHSVISAPHFGSPLLLNCTFCYFYPSILQYITPPLVPVRVQSRPPINTHRSFMRKDHLLLFHNKMWAVEGGRRKEGRGGTVKKKKEQGNVRVHVVTIRLGFLLCIYYKVVTFFQTSFGCV